MSVINTNTHALTARDAMQKVDRKLATEMQRLSTGKRINTAADDAAGLAISTRMTAQIKGLDQSVRNANDAISLLLTADGATIEITNMVQRMRELAIQARNDTNGVEDRTYLDKEFQQLRDQIIKISQQSTWNGKDLIAANGSAKNVFTFQVGPQAGQTVSITIGSFSAIATSVSGATVGIAIGKTASITNATLAGQVISALDDALNYISGERATMGAMINRLEYTVDNLTNISTNTSAARSRILDTDFAKETSDLARDQIVKQASTAMLAQANQIPQAVLQLLKS